MKRFYFFIALLLSSGSQLLAQMSVQDSDYGNTAIEMADVFRQDGKIYVVVGIIVLIFIGLLMYLITIDRKLSKLEKEFDRQ
jgi:CcmD family protein